MTSATRPHYTNQSRNKCEVWTRVMGYHRPVSGFNIGKKSEHYMRKHFVACSEANAQFESEFAGA